MFCGDCEYATRVEEELVNHVKHHQLFKILGVDKEEETDNMVDEEEEVKAVIAKATKSGLGNYDPVPMNCGDCAFTTHYENELFEHLKAHLRKDANIQASHNFPSIEILIIKTPGGEQGGEAEEEGGDHEQCGGAHHL